MTNVDIDMVHSPVTGPDTISDVSQLPVCFNCLFWLQDMRDGEKSSPWGMCTYGLPPGTTMDSRQTTDMTQCSAFDKRKAVQ